MAASAERIARVDIDVVIGGCQEASGIPNLRLVPLYTEQQLLEQVRLLLGYPLTFSASNS